MPFRRSTSSAIPTSRPSASATPAGGEDREGLSAGEIAACRRLLGMIGYAIEAREEEDAQSGAVATAFQSRFRPRSVTGRLDVGTLLRAERLLALAGLSSHEPAAYGGASQAAG